MRSEIGVLSIGKYFGKAFSDISLHRGHSLGSSRAVAGQLHARYEVLDLHVARLDDFDAIRAAEMRLGIGCLLLSILLTTEHLRTMIYMLLRHRAREGNGPCAADAEAAVRSMSAVPTADPHSAIGPSACCSSI